VNVVTSCDNRFLLDGVTGACQGRRDGECDMDDEKDGSETAKHVVRGKVVETWHSSYARPDDISSTRAEFERVPVTLVFVQVRVKTKFDSGHSYDINPDPCSRPDTHQTDVAS
jgi:hypothetical protein